MKCPKCNGRLIKDYKVADHISCMNCGWLKPFLEEEMSRVKGTCELCKRDDLMLTRNHMLCSSCYNWKIRDGKTGVPVSLTDKFSPRVKVLAKVQEDVKPKGFAALSLKVPEDYIKIDSDLIPVLAAAEITTADINNLLRACLVQNGWV